MSLNMRQWLGARLPFCAFITIAGAFTYLYHIFPMLPWVLVLLLLNLGVLATWPPKEIGTKRRTSWDWAPLAAWLLAVSAAVVFGVINYAVIESYVNVTFLREFKDVQFDTDPRAVVDGGILNFAGGTSLDPSNAAGYKLSSLWSDTYCAAPIVHTEEPAAAPVGFWAVGQGCCQSRGGFTCDSAGDTSAKSGIPVRAHSLGPKTTENYNKAIKMAAAASGLEVGKETIFVMWVSDAKSVGQAAWWTATMVFFSLCFFGLITCCACQAGFKHISDMEAAA